MAYQTAKIRLLLVDDHPVVREGLRHCLQGLEQIEIVGEAADGEEAVRKTRELRPDVVLLDINMPGLNGLQVTERLRQESPATKVLALTVHDTREYVLGIIRAGAVGYVLKDAAPAELVRAIEKVHGGLSFFSPQIAEHVLNDYVAQAGRVEMETEVLLSEREIEVLASITRGLTNKEMAQQLGVSVRTVETHRAKLMTKLNIQSVAGLIQYAVNQGIARLK